MGTCEDQCPSIDLANEISLDADSNGVVVHHSDGGDLDDSSEQALIQRLEDSHIVENGEEEEKKKEDEVEGGGELGGAEEQRNENDGPAKEGEEENEREEDEKNEEELQNESRNHPYPLRSNAEDCSFYMKTGSCKYGFNCRFNHPVNRVNQVVDADSKEHDAQRTDANGKIECKYYSTPGGCKYGDTCRYNHPKEEIDSEPLELNFLGLPIRKGEKECPYYMRNGSCGYGANCRFHHPDPAAAMEEPKNLMPNGGALHGGRSFAGRNIADCAPSMSSMPRSISNSSNSENIPSYMPWMNAIPQGVPQLSAYNQYQVPVSLPDKNMASRPGYSVNTPLKKADTFGFNPQLMQSEEFPERPGQPDCDYFMRTGTCKYRSDCRFHHPKSRLYSMPNGAIQNTMKEASPLTYHTQMSHMEEYPERPGEPECAYFMKTGDCKYKSNCKFHHPKGRSPKLTASTYGVSGLPSRSAPIASHEVKKLPDLYPSHVNQMAKPFMHYQLPTKVEEFPDRPGQPECEYFMKTGDCKYKLMCRYHHPKSSRSEVSAGSDFAVNEKGLPLRPGAKICRNYEQLGICKYGPRCLFDHPSSSNSSVIPECSAPQSPPGNSSGWDDDWVIG